MMTVLKLALRSIIKHRRRSIATALTISFALFVSVTFTASGDYSYTNMIDTSAIMGLGHVTVEPPGYNETPTLDKRIDDVKKTNELILSLPSVKDTSIRIVGQTMLQSAFKSSGGMFIAIDPTTEDASKNVYLKNISKGKLFTQSDSKQIVIGYKMAENLNLKIGKKIVYTMTDKDGEMVSQVARISGTFRTGLPEADASIVLLPFNRVKELLNYSDDEASMISIFISDQRKSKEIAEHLNNILKSPSKTALTWQDTQSDLASIIAIDSSMNKFLQILIAIVIAAGLFNAVLMSVMERKKEFGIMLAIGFSPKSLFGLIIIETMILALGGFIFGLIITSPWYSYMVTTGIDFSTLVADDYRAGGVLIDPVLKFRLYKESAIIISAGLFIISLLAAVYPAYRAVKVEPVEAIKSI